LETGVINTETLQEALSRTSAGHEQIGAVLIAMGAAGREDVRRALAAQQGIPYLMTEQLPSTLPPLKCLSLKYLRQYVACPIAVEGSTIPAWPQPIPPTPCCWTISARVWARASE
jgi:hypothetical protein